MLQKIILTVINAVDCIEIHWVIIVAAARIIVNVNLNPIQRSILIATNLKHNENIKTILLQLLAYELWSNFKNL